MIYLDYSATTPPDPAVLASFTETAWRFPGNENSSHQLGMEAKKQSEEAADTILRRLGAWEHQVIFTSGATEANNLAIKGVAQKKRHLGTHVITTPYEHASVIASFGSLQRDGFEVEFVETLPDGTVNLDSLKALLRPETILVSVGAVHGEIGIRQPLEPIRDLLKSHPFVTFHSDLTQALGKIPVPVDAIDLVSFSAHKIYGLKGIGALLRRKSVMIEPQMHGGHSTTEYRSGTPATPLHVSLATALKLALDRQEDQLRHVFGLNVYLRERLAAFPEISINSPISAIPHILNISVLPIPAESMRDRLNSRGICVSTQTACHAGGGRSEAVFRLTQDEQRARTSLRISLSRLTTHAEIDALIEALEAELRP
jgi:cysteine desulfurase